MTQHTNESFIPRGGIAQLLDFFERYLTPISIGVALIGLALVIAGPLRSLLPSGDLLNRTGTEDAPGEQSEAANPSGISSDSSGALRLDRALLAFTTIPDNRPRNEVITYTIHPGDSLFGIAEQFSIDPNTIFWANSETLGDSVHMIQPDVDLFILPVNGIYHRSNGEQSLQQIANEYNANVEDIIVSPYNDLVGIDDPSDIPGWGTRIVVPGGEREIVDWRPPIVETTDASTGQVSRSFMPGMGGSCAAGISGGGGTGAWAPPMAAYAVTQPFYPGHSGIDLAAPLGSPVLAADTGVVVFSGWVTADWGYGILVVLDHGNGWTTYYAHLSSTGVSCGQTVPRGGYVGALGSTGNSTGPHLHFEMRWNHTPDNPAAYIGF